MNKKQRNRKLITQNKRNRMINRRYTSTIKTLSKFLNNKVKSLESVTSEESKITQKSEAQKILNNLYSMIDKAIKKNVIHKNTGARKKSKMQKLFSVVSN
jgi:small subunit ribosomal protein S20